MGERNPKWLQDDYVKFLRFSQWKIQKSGYGIVGMITNHSYLDNPTFRGMRQSLMKTFDEIYILDLHGNSLKKETTPKGGKDENVFDIRQGVAISLFIKNKKQKESQVFHSDVYGLRKNKYNWLNKNKFLKDNYEKIQPQSPYYFLVRRKTANIQQYLEWKKVNEIFPLNGVGMTTARDDFVIDFDKHKLENRIRLFKNAKYDDEELHQFFNINKKKGWDIRKAWNELQSIPDSQLKNFILPVTYRPFDIRYIFWHDSVVWRTVKKVMRHMIKEYIGIICNRQIKTKEINQFWLSNLIVDLHILETAHASAYFFPLYIYPDKEKRDIFSQSQSGRESNIPQSLLHKLSNAYGKKPEPEDILYYIYGIFYSPSYREKYAEFLRIDFPRVPFTSDYSLFKEMGKFGKELSDLHLLKSPALDPPVAKYQGKGENDRIEKMEYREKEKRLYINKDKYFEGVDPKVWHYHIGGYQVLYKYLKDRKGREINDAPRYCRIVTALSKTIEIQEKIDKLYPRVEKKRIQF
ncbi:MAG: type ISP restriction/modification enzyme [Candidatus Aminicenantes bacterium]